MYEVINLNKLFLFCIICNLTLLFQLFQLNGQIYDGKLTESPGGVGRNICDALTKLSSPPIFLTAVGDDESGNVLTNSVPHQASSIPKYSDARTAQCMIVLDGRGDCRFLIGDMDVHERITEDVVRANEERIAVAPLVVLDGNPTVGTMETVLELASKHRVPVFYEPTDQPISKKPFQTKYWQAVKYITPNLAELKVIADILNITITQENNDAIKTAGIIAKAVADHIENVIVTLGDKGVIIARKNSASKPLIGVENNEVVQARHYPAMQVTNLVNVSGAGDCFAAGLITSMLDGLSEEKCVSVGFASAISALSSSSAVPKSLFDKTHPAWKKNAEYFNL